MTIQISSLTDDISKFIFIFMKNYGKEVEYTSVLIDKILASDDKWWVGLVDYKTASKWKERHKKTGLSFETKEKILTHNGYEIKVKRTEDLWGLVQMKKFKITNSAKDFGIIEAPSKEKAIIDLVKKEFPRKKTMDIGGVIYDMAEIFKTGLIVEEVKL